MQIIENPEIEKEATLKEGDIIKQIGNSRYWVVIHEPKGYILRNLKNLSFGWTGHWPSLDVLRDSITTPIQIFSKDEYELVLRKKKER